MKCGTADAPGYIPKPKESLEAWRHDVQKLQSATPGSMRAFVLVGLRRRRRSTKLYREDHLSLLTDHVQDSFPGAEVLTIREDHPLECWRDMRPAEICAFPS